MKQIVIKFINVYFYIGLTFGFINQLSWVYSMFTTMYHQASEVFNFAGIFIFGWSLVIHIIFEPIMRAILWLPSILTLLSPEIDISFLHWLAPGFYEFLISSDQ